MFRCKPLPGMEQVILTAIELVGNLLVNTCTSSDSFQEVVNVWRITMFWRLIYLTLIRLNRIKELTNLQSGSCKRNFLQCVCYRCNMLPWMVFILCDNWKTLFFTRVCRYFEILSTAIILLYLKQVFWKKSIFYVISTMQC